MSTKDFLKNKHYTTRSIPYIVNFTLPLSNFSLDRNSVSLMYCLYIRKCQSCRNVKDCRATWERLGVDKKYQLMSPRLPLTEVQPQYSTQSGVRDQSRNRQTLTPEFVIISWHYNSGLTIHQVGLAPRTGFLSGLSTHSTTGHLGGRGLSGHRSYELVWFGEQCWMSRVWMILLSLHKVGFFKSKFFRKVTDTSENPV